MPQAWPTIIIPAYNAPQALRACLVSVARHTPRGGRIIVIDDASPDAGVQDVLADFRDRGRFECHRNPENLGFTRTVNKGLRLAGDGDVVLLNADTQVTAGWVTRLRAAAYSDARVGTATPFSDNAGMFSAPVPGANTLPEGLGLDRFARALAQGSARRYPRVPTGNGFCLYIRHDCLADVGLLDEQAFPRGYGEENDLCMRALRHGWVHVVDDATYIHHARSLSFGEEKQALMAQGRRVIHGRYPEYPALVRQAFKGTALLEARRRVAVVSGLAAGGAAKIRPRVLVVGSRGTPGSGSGWRRLSRRAECFRLQRSESGLTLHCLTGGDGSVVAHLDDPDPARLHGWLAGWAFEWVYALPGGSSDPLSAEALSDMLGIDAVGDAEDLVARINERERQEGSVSAPWGGVAMSRRWSSFWRRWRGQFDATMRRHVALLQGSVLFEGQWYLSCNPDVAGNPGFARCPARHYLLVGGSERRKPSAWFDPLEYLELHPDVAAAGVEPLLHYLRYGREEGRFPGSRARLRELGVDLSGDDAAASLDVDDAQLVEQSGVFDRQWYLAEYRDVARSGQDPLIHYLRDGLAERRRPGPGFDPGWYVACYGEQMVLDHPLLDYLRVGRARGRQPVPVVPVQALGPVGDRPRLLFVLATRSGGTPQTNQDLMTALAGHFDTWVLHCNGRVLSLEHFADGWYAPVVRHALREPIQAFPHRSDEYDAVVAEWLERYGFSLVHVRHIARHGLGLVDVARARGLPVVFSFHDYYAVCPSVKLLDERWRHCQGICTDSPGECSTELWEDVAFPPLKHAAVREWQARFASVLAQCNAFVTTSPSARALLQARFPVLKARPFPVIAHGRQFTEMACCVPPGGVQADEPLRVLVPGNISTAKGAREIAALAGQARDRGFELHLLGALDDTLRGAVSSLGGTSAVVWHGTYSREAFQAHVRRIQPHVAAVLSIWPETYCHTLTESWACGLPVIGFDLGAVGERIRATGGGWLAPSMTAAGVLDIIEAIREHPDDWRRRHEAVLRWQQGEGLSRDCEAMAREYVELYESVDVDKLRNLAKSVTME